MGKNKKLKIPKRIAGVKIPKKLRKRAKIALALSESPLARDLVTAGLTAAAAAIASSEEGRRAAKASVDQAGDAADEATRSASRTSDAFAKIARQVALGLVAAYADSDGKGEREVPARSAEKEGAVTH